MLPEDTGDDIEALDGSDESIDDASDEEKAKYLNDLSDHYAGDEDLVRLAYAYTPEVVDDAIVNAGADPESIEAYITGKAAPRRQQQTQEEGEEGEPAYRYQSPDTSVREGTEFGTVDDASQQLRNITHAEGFVDLPFQDKMAELSKLYRSRPVWDEDAEKVFKDTSTVIWKHFGEQSPVSIPEIVGAPEFMLSDTKDPEGTIEAWRTSAVENLENRGVNPTFLGNQLDAYLKDKGDQELTAFYNRNRGRLGWGVRNAASSIADLGKGVIRNVTDIAAGVTHMIDQGTGDAIAGLPDYIPTANEYIYDVDPVTGYARTGLDGRPMTRHQSAVMQGIGQIGSYMMGIKGAAKLGYEGFKLGAGVVGFNVLQSLEGAYQESRAAGGTHEQSVNAALLNAGPAGVESLADMFIAAGASPYLKGLKWTEKVRYLTPEAAKIFTWGMTSNVLQQASQSAIVGEVLDKNIQSLEKLGPAALMGGFGAAVSMGFDYIHGVDPKPIRVDPTWSASKVAEVLRKNQPNQPIKVYTSRPEEYRQLIKDHGLEDRDIEFKGYYREDLSPGTATAKNAQAIKELTNAQERLAKFKESHASEMTLTAEEAAGIDERLLLAYDFRREVNGSGFVIKKNENAVFVDAKELADVDRQIELLTEKLRESPLTGDADALWKRKQLYTKALSKYAAEHSITPEERTILTERNKLISEYESALRSVKNAKANRDSAKDGLKINRQPGASKAPTSDRHLKAADLAVKAAESRLAETEAALKAQEPAYNNFVSEAAKRIEKLQKRRDTVDRHLKAIPSDTYLNNLKATSRELWRLINKRNDIIAANNEKLEKLQAEKAAAEKGEAADRRRKLKIQTAATDREILEGGEGLTLKDGHQIIFSDDRWHLFGKDDVWIRSDADFRELLKYIPEHAKEMNRHAAEDAQLAKEVDADEKDAKATRKKILKQALEEKEKDFTDAEPAKEPAATGGKKRRAIRRKTSTAELPEKLPERLYSMPERTGDPEKDVFIEEYNRAVADYNANMQASRDFNFSREERAAARAQAIESLQHSKAVKNGMDYREVLDSARVKPYEKDELTELVSDPSGKDPTEAIARLLRIARGEAPPTKTKIIDFAEAKKAKTRTSESPGSSTLKGGYKTQSAPYEVKVKTSKAGNMFATTHMRGELRNLINYMIDGLHVGGKGNEVFITTHEDLMQSSIDKYFTAEQLEHVRDLRKRLKKHDTLGITLEVGYDDGRTFKIISLRDHRLNQGSALVAAHEIGHAFMHDLWRGIVAKSAKSPKYKELAQSIVDDFNAKQRELKAESDLTLAEARMIMEGGLGYKYPDESGMLLSEAPKKFTERLLHDKELTVPKTSKEALVQANDIEAFREFLANRFAQWATEMSSGHFRDAKRLFTGTGNTMKTKEDFYKTVGYGLYKIWKSLRDIFGRNVTLTKFLNSVFDREAAYGSFYTEAAERSKVFGKKRERKISERVRTSEEIASAILRKEHPLFYLQQGHPEVERQVQDFIGKYGRGALTGVYRGRTKFDGVKALMGVEIVRDFEREIRALTDKGEVEKALGITQDQHIFLDEFAEEATGAGQYVSALKAMASLTEQGMIRYYKKKLLAPYNKSKMVLPKAYEEAIERSISEYYKDFSKTTDGVVRELLHAAMYKDLANRLAGLTGSSMPLNELMWFGWYGNTLAGGSTFMANLGFTGTELFFRTVINGLVSHPKDSMAMIKSLSRAIKYGLIESRAAIGGKPIGVLRGTKMAKTVQDIPVVKALSVNLRRYMEAHPTLKAMLPEAAKQMLHWTAIKGDLAANLYLKAISFYPFRSMNAVDAFMGRTAEELRVAQTASRLVRERIKEGKLSKEDYADELAGMLHNTEGDWEVAILNAEQDFRRIEHSPAHKKMYSANTIKLRALEYIENSRPEEVRLAAQEYARERTYVNDPKGSAQYLSRVVAALTNTLDQNVAAKLNIPFAKMIAPFNRVTCNILSSYLDFSPIGIIRGYTGMHLTHLGGKGDYQLKFTKNKKTGVMEPVMIKDPYTGKMIQDKERVMDFSWESRKEKMAVGTLSTAVLSIIGSIASQYLMDDDPEVAIYGAGPVGQRTKQNWRAQNHIPYSIYIKSLGINVRLSEFPAGPALSVLGNVFDAMRWKKDYEGLNTAEKTLLMGQLVTKTFTEIGTLRSLNEFMEMMTGERKWGAWTARFVKGFLPYNGLMRDMASIGVITGTDTNAMDPNDMRATFMYNLPYFQTHGVPGFEKYTKGRVALNAFAEPIQKMGRLYNVAKDDKVWRYLGEHGLTISGIPGKVTIGAGSSLSEKARMSYYLRNREKVMARFAYNVFTDQEAYEHLMISGPRIKKRVAQLMTQGGTFNKERMQKKIDDIVSEERARAKMEILARSDAAIRAGKLPD